MELYIVRHGETPWNEQHLLQGRTDIALNENGRQLARETGIALHDVPFDRIFSSPLQRAYETANLILGNRRLEIQTDDRLKEISFGSYEGGDSKKLFADLTDPFHYFFSAPELYRAPADGESFEAVCARAASFLKEEIEPHEKEWDRIMITAHGALNKALLCHIKNHGIADYWSGDLQKNCGVCIVRLENGIYQVLDECKLFYKQVS
ncbi:MAG: histidine phosphatase family protein [Lachnospiraceae bacterium]|nr:histidine phosphatase family protein [Lachnospiraceae bacterium]